MTSPDDYDWFELLSEPVRVDVRHQGDEWLDNLYRRLGETTGSTTFQSRREEPYGVLHTPAGGSIDSSLLIQARDNEPVCYVVGNNPKRREGVDPWIEAIAFAVAQLGSTTEFPWWSTIGEDPDYPISPTLQLARSCSIGHIDLYPTQERYFEHRPHLSSISIAWTLPVHVHGSSRGYAWNAASQGAVTDLKVICSLLSLASGRIWRLRMPPQLALRLPDQSPISEPPTLPKYSPFFPEELRRDDNYGDPTLFDLPSWIDEAWATLRGDRELTQLVATYHESLLLETQHHDSYSLLASVAIVEAIGNRGYKKLPRCPKCKSIQGSTERFRSALRRVVDNDAAVDLARVVYGQRSKTAHNGTLHGTEFVVGGHSGASFMSENLPAQFGYTTRVLRHIAAKLLRAELAPTEDSGLPASTS